MKYLQNKLRNNLVAGRVTVEPGRHVPISDAEAETTEVIYAIRSDWAAVYSTPPADIIFDDIPTVEFAKPAIEGFATPQEAIAASKGEEVAEEADPVVETATDAEPTVEDAEPAAKPSARKKTSAK